MYEPRKFAIPIWRDAYKDGIVDYFERHGRARPNVDKEQPDLQSAYLNRDDVVLSSI